MRPELRTGCLRDLTNHQRERKTKMADVDITAKDTRVNGILSDEIYVKQEAHVIDFVELGVNGTGTHDLFKLAPGDALVGLTVIVLDAVTSDGSATVQFKAKFNASAEALKDAIAKADLAKGDVIAIPVPGVKGYDADYGAVIQATVGTADLTAGKAMLIASVVPAKQFQTRG